VSQTVLLILHNNRAMNMKQVAVRK